MSHRFFTEVAQELDKCNRIDAKPVLNKPEPGRLEKTVLDIQEHWKAISLVALFDIGVSVALLSLGLV